MAHCTAPAPLHSASNGRFLVALLAGIVFASCDWRVEESGAREGGAFVVAGANGDESASNRLENVSDSNPQGETAKGRQGNALEDSLELSARLISRSVAEDEALHQRTCVREESNERKAAGPQSIVQGAAANGCTAPRPEKSPSKKFAGILVSDDEGCVCHRGGAALRSRPRVLRVLPKGPALRPAARARRRARQRLQVGCLRCDNSFVGGCEVAWTNVAQMGPRAPSLCPPALHPRPSYGPRQRNLSRFKLIISVDFGRQRDRQGRCQAQYAYFLPLPPSPPFIHC